MLYINDLLELEGLMSTARLFADHCAEKIYGICQEDVNRKPDQPQLQQDLNRLAIWGKKMKAVLP